MIRTIRTLLYLLSPRSPLELIYCCRERPLVR